MKEWVMIHKIKALHDEGRGLSVRGIARELRISRNTVRKYLAMDEAMINEKQESRSRSRKLDSYRDYIVGILGQFPGLSAVKVLRKLRERHPDLSVSERSARRYVRQLKETVTLKQKRYYETVMESVPGVQCQVDGGELRGVEINGSYETIYFVVFVLSYSRLMFVGVSDRPIDTSAFILMHDAAFRYFGGCPEECVYDQTRLVVIKEEYRELRLNQAFAAYATGAGFRIHACEGYDPESKGKVEAGVKYVKNNCLSGEVFEDWGHLKSHVAKWLDEVANERCHGTTGEAPRERFERDERGQLRSYFTPAFIADPGLVETRKVDKTGLICWRANKYTAPMVYQGARVRVRSEGCHLVLSDLESGQEIARHRMAQGKGEIVRNNDHYRDKATRIADLEAEITGCIGQKHGQRLCALLKQTNPRIYKDQLSGVRRLLSAYDSLPEAVIQRLCNRPCLTATQCRTFLEAYATDPSRFCDQVEKEPASATPLTELRQYAQLTHALEVYNDFIH